MGNNMTENIYKIQIDYSKSLDRMVNAGEYDWVNDNITADHFPVKGEGRREADIVLFHFDKNMESGDVIAEMNKEGYRPAAIEELAALGREYPDLQRQFPIVAMGSVWQGSDGYRFVPCLFRFGSERSRSLDLYWFDLRWSAPFRFAAVRKRKSPMTDNKGNMPEQDAVKENQMKNKEAQAPAGREWEEELREKLAAIEHERWSNWQRYLHGLCVEQPESKNLVIVRTMREHWERQMNTHYDKLTEAEKDSNRKEVDKYLPLLKDLLESQKAEYEDEISASKLLWKRLNEWQKEWRAENYKERELISQDAIKLIEWKIEKEKIKERKRIGKEIKLLKAGNRKPLTSWERGWDNCYKQVLEIIRTLCGEG